MTSETLDKPRIKPHTSLSSSTLKSFASLRLKTLSNWGCQQDFLVIRKVAEGATCCASVCASLTFSLRPHLRSHGLPKGLWPSALLFLSEPVLAHYPLIPDHAFQSLARLTHKSLQLFCKTLLPPSTLTMAQPQSSVSPSNSFLCSPPNISGHWKITVLLMVSMMDSSCLQLPLDHRTVYSPFIFSFANSFFFSFPLVTFHNCIAHFDLP